MRRTLLAALFLVAILCAPGSSPAAHAEDDLVHIKSHVVYNIQPDQGPVTVTWDINIVNNDPQTENFSGGGTNTYYYDTFTFPLLAGASTVEATSSAGVLLDIRVEEPGRGPAIPATIKLDRRMFYQDTYDLHLTYKIPEARHPALIVIPSYAFVPLLASGDEATVEVFAPAAPPWETSIEAIDCAPSGPAFTCAAADGVFVAAITEAARPDLTATLSTEVQLRDQKVSVNITYFQGEEAFAQHVSDLAANGLPVIEDIYGLTYSGPGAINVSERVRQVILGYEGLTSCDAATACEVNISPIADDYTVLHELAHLWSGLYAKRWLSEGFAQYVSLAAAPYLPAGLITVPPPARQQASVELQLDDWGEVDSVIGASEDDLAVENAGYYRSQRFLEQMEFELGVETLRRTNQVIGQSGSPADSRRFMDVLEEVSGRNNDALFQEWVFPDSLDPLLADRREARDRLTNVIARAQEAELTEDVPGQIQEQVDAWLFQEAFAALDEAEAGLDAYDGLRVELARLRDDAATSGLVMAEVIEALIDEWDFEGAAATVEQAFEALTAYGIALEKVDAPRSAWEQFGLLGSDPEASVERAAAAFNDGDYTSAIDHADKAIEAIDGASKTAVRRVLIVAGILVVFAVVILGAVWLSHRREPDFA